MKNKGLTIGIIISIIFLIILSLIIVFAVKDLNQEEKLENEIENVIKLININPMNNNKINIILNRTITTKKYSKVEKAIKSYLKEITIVFNKSYQIVDNDKISYFLTIENYKTDGKEFPETLKYITETKENIENINKDIENLSSKKVIKSYIDNKNLDTYYNNLYYNLIYEEDNLKINSGIDNYYELLNNIENLIIFLKENKDNWIIQDNKIAFNNNDLINNYNDLLDKIN